MQVWLKQADCKSVLIVRRFESYLPHQHGALDKLAKVATLSRWNFSEGSIPLRVTNMAPSSNWLGNVILNHKIRVRFS